MPTTYCEREWVDMVGRETKKEDKEVKKPTEKPQHDWDLNPQILSSELSSQPLDRNSYLTPT